MSEALSSSPSPRVGRKASSEGSSRAAMAAARARASCSASSSISSSELVCRISRCWAVAAPSSAVLIARQRIGHRLAGRPIDERGQLDQLQVAHGAVGDVEVGVQAQLAQAPGGARDGAQQLVAQRGEGGVQRLVGAEELLGALLPRRLQRGARLLQEGRGVLQGAADRALGVAEDEPLARAGHRDVQQPAHVVDVLGARVGRELLVQQRVGDRLGHAPARAGHARRLQAEDEHVAELAPLRGVHGQDADGAVAALAGASSSSSCRPASATADT